MRVVRILAGILAAASASCGAQSSAAQVLANAQRPVAESPTVLVREVVYNELHDHDRHGFWRYWVRKQGVKESRLEEQVETSDGPLTRVLLTNGHPLNEQAQHAEDAKLEGLITSSSQRASHRQAYHEDENRIGRILGLLPDAFLFEDQGEVNGQRHLRFHPNPNYPAHSIEARIFHAMSGELWIDARMKRLALLHGAMTENVDFGFGLLGRLNKGGWFEMQRTQVSETDWKTDRLEVHMSGRALLFKTIARETSEVRGGFEPVQAHMSLEQGVRLLEDGEPGRKAAELQAHVTPAALPKAR